MCVTVRFTEKLELLMRRGAHSNLSLGKALDGIAHTTVARWRKGSIPRGAAALKLAAYFKVPVEILTNDTRDLPPDAALEEIQARYGAVAALIEKIPADQPGLRQTIAEQLIEGGQHTKALKETAKRLRDLADELDPPTGKKNLDEIVARGQAQGKGHRRPA